jgi:uncharacterized DUF497 family protein
VEITFDPRKSERNVRERGLDFEMVAEFNFSSAVYTVDTRKDYGEARYAAGTWKRERRVIIKAEVVRAEEKAPKDNPRFVITNMKQTPQWLYEEVYCQRGEIENRIKELYALEIDRTSCSLFSTPATKTHRWGPRSGPISSACC